MMPRILTPRGYHAARGHIPGRARPGRATLARMGRFHPAKGLSTWRKVALSTWGEPMNPTAYGVLDLDVGPALAFIARLRDTSGEKITLTHLVGKIIGICIAAHPEVNGFVSMGRLMLRETVDIFFQVAFFDDEVGKTGPRESRSRAEGSKKANLAGAKIREVDRKSVVEIARELREKAEAIRARGEADTVKSASAMSSVPGPAVGLALRAASYLHYDLGLDLKRFGMPNDGFGSCMITNIGVFGLEVGFAPLLPVGRVPLILTLGAVRDVARVADGKVVAAKGVSIGTAFDHRVMDGYHAGVMAKRFRQIFESPDTEL
jgi:pyruvate dehydrogenase E2 component (dihydrolipoamide acetyltransferase)